MINTSFLNEIVTIIENNRDEQETYQALVTLFREVVPFDCATLFLYKENCKKLIPVYQFGDEIVDLAVDFSFKDGMGISGWISQKREPVVLENLLKCESQKGRSFNSFLSMPLWGMQELLGVFNLGHHENGFYQKSDFQDYKIVAAQMALIIEKYRMKSRLDHQNRELKQALESLKIAQSELVEKERLAAIGELVITVNHEINNPLTAIMGLAEILDLSLHSAGEVKIRAGLRKILQESQRIEKVTQRLRELKTAASTPYLGDERMIKI